VADEARQQATIHSGDPDVLTLVRRNVKDLLTRSDAFRRLPPEQQNQVAQGMTQVAAYLAAPEVIKTNTLPGTVAIVHGVRDASGTLLTEVDFPNFVAGLISGVFRAIVDASIRQMDAYAELVKNVAQAVSQFLQDNISEDDSRRFLAATYPEYFELDPNPDCHKLRLRDHLHKSEAIGRLSSLPLEAPLQTLDQHEIDWILVPSGRRRLAAQRQQLVASMVLMGINRIVVTERNIPAR
jgi:hypothetical protein